MVSLPPNFEKVKKNTCVTQCSRTAHRRPERPQKTGQERFEKADARERERRERESEREVTEWNVKQRAWQTYKS